MRDPKGSVHDDAPIRVELGPMVGAGRIGPKLEHAAGCMHRSRDRTLLLPLARLAKIDEECVPLFDLYCHLVNC